MNKLKRNDMPEPGSPQRRAALISIDGLGDTARAPTVEVTRLVKTYPGGVEAVKGIDFDVAPGEVFGLLGPNGAGKSTTIGMLTTTMASRPAGRPHSPASTSSPTRSRLAA